MLLILFICLIIAIFVSYYIILKRETWKRKLIKWGDIGVREKESETTWKYTVMWGFGKSNINSIDVSNPVIALKFKWKIKLCLEYFLRTQQVM